MRIIEKGQLDQKHELLLQFREHLSQDITSESGENQNTISIKYHYQCTTIITHFDDRVSPCKLLLNFS